MKFLVLNVFNINSNNIKRLNAGLINSADTQALG